MTKNKLDRTLATRTFEYGNHDIEINVGVQYKYHNEFSDVMNGIHNNNKLTYYRWATVEAVHPEGGVEAAKESYVRLTANTRPPKTISLPFIGDVTVSGAKTIPSIEDQIEYSTRLVLEQLDEIYQFTDKEVKVDVEVGVERVEHEISWVEVEDEIDRISSEIDAMTEVTQ